MAGLTVSTAKPTGNLTMGSAPAGSRAGQVYWTGADGNIWLRETNGKTTNLGSPQQAQVWNLGLNGAQEIADPVPGGVKSNNGNVLGAGTGAPAKVLDTAQLASLDSLIGSLGSIKDQGIQKAAIKRDTMKREKDEEKKQEESKYKGKKLSTLQDFAGAKTDTDLNTRDTLENLVSSLSTLGLGGSRALTRQILDASNKANRKANATQATTNQGLDTAFNDYTVGNENDMKKIEDQYGYDAGEANRKYLQDKQTALLKKADVYNAADKTGERQSVMNEADSLNGMIAGAAFMNPSYTGEKRAMADAPLADYTQDIAKYDTAGIGMDGTTLTPVASDGMNAPGNLAVRAIAVNDKDLGIKKKTENDLGYGV